MALSDALGKNLEVFASKSTSEATAPAFAAQHPAALSFTTDEQIVFAGRNYTSVAPGWLSTTRVGDFDFVSLTPSLSELGSVVQGSVNTLSSKLGSSLNALGSIPLNANSSVIPNLIQAVGTGIESKPLNTILDLIGSKLVNSSGSGSSGGQVEITSLSSVVFGSESVARYKVKSYNQSLAFSLSAIPAPGETKTIVIDALSYGPCTVAIPTSTPYCTDAASLVVSASKIGEINILSVGIGSNETSPKLLIRTAVY